MQTRSNLYLLIILSVGNLKLSTLFTFFLAVKRSIKNRVKNILQIHFSLWHSIKDKQHFPSKASIVNRWAEWIYCPTPISYQPNCPTNYSSLYSAVLFYSDGRGLQMIFTCVGCLFVVGGVRVLLWIWLWELSWSAILISAGLWSNATSSKSTLISAELVYRPGDFTTTTAQGRFWEVGGMNTLVFALINFSEATVAWKTFGDQWIDQSFEWLCESSKNKSRSLVESKKQISVFMKMLLIS